MLLKSKYLNSISAAAALAVGAMVAGSMASAATLTVSLDDSNPLATAGLNTFTTSGTSASNDSDMDGLLATGSFTSGPAQALTFADGSTGAGSFTLTQSGTTFTSAWTLTVASGFTLTSLLLEGAPGDTIFDLSNPSPGSEGSANGRTFDESTNLDGAIAVTYSNPVGITPDAPVGDLYESMFIDLSGLAGGGLMSGQTLRFRQDTDNLSISGDITPVNPVPLPAGGFMMIAAMGGLGALRLRPC